MYKFGFIYHFSYSKIKASDQLTSIIKPLIAAPQCSIANWDRWATSPKRRLWRMKRGDVGEKTRSIAPAPRAIGDYVLRGLNGLRSKTHEPVLLERSEFTGECAELLTESRELGTAARLREGTGGDSPCFAFLLQAFSFSNKKKMPKRGKCEKFDYSGTRR